MHATGWAFLRVWLNRFGHQLQRHDFQNAFLSDLPIEKSQEILSQSVSSRNPQIALSFPETILEYIHYSWVAPTIQKMPESLQVRMLGLLPPPLAAKLQEVLNLKPIQVEYASTIRQFLIKDFTAHLDIHEVLPKEFLSDGPLSQLLTLSKQDLVILFDLLSMHDLAEEMRQIVDNKVIKSVYHSLKPHQHRHLYLCLHQPDKVVSPPLDLSGWNGNVNTLQKKLHVRGMVRLGRALSGEHPDFIWHIVHTLDTGRGTLLKHHIHEKAIPKVTTALQGQVLQTINYIKSKSQT